MRHARACAFFGVLVIARLLTLAGTRIPVSPWTPVAYLWQDAAAAGAFAILDWMVRRESFACALYGVSAAYVAVNVPVARVLSSPLTPTLIRAAGGPLADSIRYYLTAANAALVLVVVCAAIVLPKALAGWHPRFSHIFVLICAGGLMIAAGPHAVSKIDTAGRYRNALGALWPAHIDRVSGNSENQDWRVSPFPGDPGAQGVPGALQRFRGAAIGRNVVMVLLESTAARYWPAGASGQDAMPNLTAFTARGIHFQRAYAVYPESIKGLLSVLCSRYPAFGVPAEAYSGVACPSVAQELQRAGYRTALFHSGRFMYLGMPAVIENRGFEVLEDAGAIGGNVHSSFGVDDKSTVQRILRWVDSLNRNERFFVTYLPVAGHHPYAAPEPGPFIPSGADSEVTHYRNALHYGDDAIGELLDGFRARGLDQNTLFVFFGDHGEAFGQHDGNFGHTLFIYDENVHVPYVIAAPGLIQERIGVAQPASLIDTAPTILDLLGLPLSAAFDGSSLLDPRPRMSLFFTDYSLGWLGLADACRKYLFEIDSSRSRLFDVCNDPDEINDLSQGEPDRVKAYRLKLQSWIAAMTDRLCASCVPSPLVPALRYILPAH